MCWASARAGATGDRSLSLGWLTTTNIIESPHAGVRIRTRRVTNWQNGAMARRWMASAFLRTEKNFRRIMGYKELWTLEAILSESQAATQLEVKSVA